MSMTLSHKLLISLFTTVLFNACNEQPGKQSADPAKPADTIPAAPAKTDTPNKPAAQRPPTINIADSISPKRIVLYMKDSAASTDRIGMKLGIIYGEKLAKCVKDNKINVTGAPMAWYNSQEPPFFFEAGMPVDKKPVKLPPGVMIREMEAGTVLVAHFYGPYEMSGMAYTAAADRMAATKATAAGKPYEIYIGDPGIEKDPYKVLTDIVFPVKLPAEKKE